MEVRQALFERQSVRHFDGTRAVEEDMIWRLLQAACQSPSAGNAQTWRFFVVTDATKKQALSEAAGYQGFISEAPVVVVVAADLQRASLAYGERGERLYCIQECAAATMGLMLAAHEEGLGTCWVGAFDERHCALALNLGPRTRPLAIVPLGYPGRMGKKPARRDARQVVEWL